MRSGFTSSGPSPFFSRPLISRSKGPIERGQHLEILWSTRRLLRPHHVPQVCDDRDHISDLDTTSSRDELVTVPVDGRGNDGQIELHIRAAQVPDLRPAKRCPVVIEGDSLLAAFRPNPCVEIS